MCAFTLIPEGQSLPSRHLFCGSGQVAANSLIFSLAASAFSKEPSSLAAPTVRNPPLLVPGGHWQNRSHRPIDTAGARATLHHKYFTSFCRDTAMCRGNSISGMLSPDAGPCRNNPSTGKGRCRAGHPARLIVTSWSSIHCKCTRTANYRL